MVTYIDLFAGAGGLSEGFIRNGFSPITHIESDYYSCLTLKTRLAYHFLASNNRISEYYQFLKGKITRDELYDIIPKQIINSVIQEEINENSIRAIFERINKLNRDLQKYPIDIIIGGPPCQAYSVMGRVADKNRKKYDKGNYLYKLYGQFLAKFLPKIFVFENVQGLRTAGNGQFFEDIKLYYDNLRYHIKDYSLNASNFGVLQKRIRIIIIGIRKDFKKTFPKFNETHNPWTIKDIFNDLPKLKAGDSIHVGCYRKEPSEYLRKYKLRNRFDILTQHITRPHNKRDLQIYKLAIELWNTKHQRLKNSDIPPEIRTQKNIKSFLDRFKVVALDQHSHTMIAHIAKDGHHYIHPDLEQLRSISVREAARIQAFPDSYFFEGPRTSVLTQIGNAVPPLLSDTIACKVMELLK